MSTQFDPLKSIEFQREFFSNAIQQSNARKVSELRQIQKKELQLTPSDIGRAQRRLKISNMDTNLLSRYIDGYV